jgi:WD40 repeat protein
MSRASVAIETLRKRNPLAVRLAEAVSFAVVVDRALLRAARLELVPQADAGTEADLWFSSMVQSRTADGIVLDREVAEEVRKSMTPAEVEAAWRVLSREHAWLSPSLKLEEEIAYLSVSAEAGAHELMVERIQSVIRAMLGGNRPGLAQWASRALAMFPSAVRDLPETRMLDAGTRIRLGQGVQTAADEPLPSWMSLLAPSSMARTELQVELRERELVLGGASGTAIHVPDTNPRVIEVAWEEEGRARAKQVTLRRGETTRVPVGDDVVRLRTITGEQYDVREVADPVESLAAEVIDFSEEIARHGRVVGREDRLERLLQSSGLVTMNGEHGVGKTAVLCELIRLLAPAPVFVHFFRTGNPRLESVEIAQRSLAAQIAIRYRLDSSVADLPLQHVLERLALSPRRPERMYIVIDDLQDARAEGHAPHVGPPLSLLLPSVPDFVTVYASRRDFTSEDLSESHVRLGPVDSTTLAEFTGDERLASLSEGNFGKAEVLVALAKADIELESFSDARRALASPELDLLAVARRPLPFQFDAPPRLRAVLRQSDTGVALLNRTLQNAVAWTAAEPHLELVRWLEKSLHDERVLDYYTLYAPDHLLEAGDQERAQRLVRNPAFMREVVRRHGAAMMRDHLRRVSRAADTAPGEGLESVPGADLAWARLALAAFEAQFDALTAAPEDLEAILAAYFDRKELHLPAGFLVAESAPRDRQRLPPRRHEQPITGCARIDENHVATWSSDGTLMLWPREERSLGPFVVRGPAAITAFAQVGAFAVVGDALGFLHVVRTDSGELASKVTGHDGAVAGAVAAEGMPLVATWSDDAVIRLWTVASPEGIIEEAGELAGHEDEVTGCAFVGGARLLVSSSRDGTVRVWNVAERRAVRISRKESPVTAMTVAADGSWFAAGDEAGRLRIELVEPATTPYGGATVIDVSDVPIRGLTTSRDARFAATWRADGAIETWRISGATGFEMTEAASKREALIVACAFVGPQPRLFVSRSDGTAVLIGPDKTQTAIDTGGAVLRAAADFGDHFYTGDDRGGLVEWEVRSGRKLRDYSKATGRIEAVAVGEASHVLVSDGERKVWFDGSGQPLILPDGRIEVRGNRAAVWSPVSGAVYSAELFTGRLDIVTHRINPTITACASGGPTAAIAAGHHDGTVLLFDSPIHVEIRAPQTRANALAFVSYDTALVSAYASGELTLTQARTSQSFDGRIDKIISIEVDDVWKRLAVTSADDTIRVLSHANGLTLVTTLQGKIDPTVRCRFSLDGSSLIASDRDHVIHIWDPATAEERAVCRGHRARITGIAVGEDVIFSSSEDRTVRMWDLATGEQLAVVYGYNAFRCIDANAHAIVAGDDAGQLWRFRRPAPALGGVQVFISNAHEDRELAEKLDADLRKWGVRTWGAMSRLSPGEQWDEAINQALRRSAALLVISSEASRVSQSVRHELTAFEMRKDPFIFAVTVDDTRPLPDLAPFDMRRWRDPFAYERQFDELMARLRSRLGGEETVA